MKLLVTNFFCARFNLFDLRQMILHRDAPGPDTDEAETEP
jgi:hypothetical protein